MRVIYLLRKTVPSREVMTLQAVTMAAEMARAGADVELVVPGLETDDLAAAYHFEPTPRLRVVVLRSPWNPRFNRWRGTSFQRALHRLLTARSPGRTVAYLRGEKALEVAAALLARREKTGVPVVYEAHKIYRDWHAEKGGRAQDRKARRVATLERAVYGSADGLIPISRSLEAAIQGEYGSAVPSRVVANGTAPNPDADRLDRDVDAVYAGDLAPWKGVDTLIDSWERLPDRDLRVLGGREPARVEALRADVSGRGLADRVSVMGPRPAGEIPPLLARTRVVPIPLPDDNAQAARYTSPLKLFQALEAGCAVVASDLPSIREVVTHDRDALLVPPGDPAALAGAVERILADADLRARLGAAGRETARAYHWSRRARAVLAFLESVLAPECPASVLHSGG